MDNQAYTIVTFCAATYTALLTLSHRLSLPASDLRTNLKALSGLHATLTTGLALHALRRPWPVERPLPPLNLGLGASDFNDSANPMIAGQSGRGNAVTGWETGYLLFDSAALIYLSLPAHSEGSEQRRRSPVSAVVSLAKKDPLILTHHLALLAGLGTLQFFIARGRERGVYIILTFILMNASTPLLHLRWWRRKCSGQASVGLDVLLAAVFAATRVGSVLWVLRKYGRFHAVGVWEALWGQRWVCQVGTGMLVGMNGVWLGRLCASIVRRVMKAAASKPR